MYRLVYYAAFPFDVVLESKGEGVARQPASPAEREYLCTLLLSMPVRGIFICPLITLWYRTPLYWWSCGSVCMAQRAHLNIWSARVWWSDHFCVSVEDPEVVKSSCVLLDEETTRRQNKAVPLSTHQQREQAQQRKKWQAPVNTWAFADEAGQLVTWSPSKFGKREKKPKFFFENLFWEGIAVVFVEFIILLVRGFTGFLAVRAALVSLNSDF